MKAPITMPKTSLTLACLCRPSRTEMAQDQQDSRTPDQIAEDTELESSSHSSPAYSGRGRRNSFNAGTGSPSLDDYDAMRQNVDSNDALMGSRIVGPRSYRGRKMPTWAMND